MPHKFKLKQPVRMVRQGTIDARLFRGDVWEVVRLMPSDVTGEPAYRISANGVERAAREDELQPA